MLENPRQSAQASPQASKFAAWLDALVPAAFPNDAALAKAIGVQPSTVLRWRRGAVPANRALRAIAQATGMDLAILQKIAGRPTNGRKRRPAASGKDG